MIINQYQLKDGSWITEYQCEDGSHRVMNSKIKITLKALAPYLVVDKTNKVAEIDGQISLLQSEKAVLLNVATPKR